MLVWMIYPPHFDPNRKYPAILYCEGGPQSTVSQFWSYRWNFQQMAANGYIIVAPNRRGLPGFGQDGWNKSAGIIPVRTSRITFPLSTKLKKNLISMKTGSDV